jgi:aryl-phospho-beta-D-glucosidase BglC (GH1 family)
MTTYPSISGTAQIGLTLTALTGGIQAPISYQWNRAGAPISGATGSTYVPVAADVGNTLTVKIGSTRAATSAVKAAAVPMGINLAGPEFGGTVLPGVYNVDYTFPTDAELQYYQSKGLTLVRLPLQWERFQHSLFSALDNAYVGLVKTFVAQAAARGMKVILDVHNYCRYTMTTPLSLTYSDGTAATGINVRGTADSSFNAATTPDLLSSYMTTFPGNTKAVTITGLTPSGNYTLYLYGQNGFVKDRGTTFSITTGTGSPHSGSNASTVNASGTAYVLNANYVIFDVTADVTGTLVISYRANPVTAWDGAYAGANAEGDLNGLQLNGPLPSAATLDVSFTGGSAHALTILGAYTGDGVGTPAWNGLIRSVSGASSSLTYSNGTAATGIAISFVSDSAEVHSTTPDLLSSSIYSSGSTKTVTLTGLVPSGSYVLYMYGQNGSFKDRGTTFSIMQGSGSPASGSNASTVNAAGTTYVLNTNYVIFNVTADVTGTLVISYTANPVTAWDGAYAGANTIGELNALQLIPVVKTLDINFSGALHGITILGAYTGDGIGSPTWNNLFPSNMCPIGSPQVPYAAFADLWTKLAGAFKGQPGIYGYDIMNEPHDMGGGNVWPTAAQAAVNAIRAVDKNTLIIVEGDGYAGSLLWNNLNANLNIIDPSNNLMYEAHCYFDPNGYVQTYSQIGGYPTMGVDAIQPFLGWLKKNNFRGYVGEYGIPNNDAPWLLVLDLFLAAVKGAGLPGTYWAGGPWWGSYTLSCEPTAVPMGGTDAVQMSILKKYPPYGR